MSQSEDPVSLRYIQKPQALLPELRPKTYEERIPRNSFLQSFCRTPKESECSHGCFCENECLGKCIGISFIDSNQSVPYQKRKTVQNL